MTDNRKRECMVQTIVLGLLLLAAPRLTAAPLQLVVQGRPNAEVVLDLKEPQRQLQYAAQELTNWLGRISGGVIPVAGAPGKGAVKIYLGTPRHSPAIAAFSKECPGDFKRLEGSDGFIIRRRDDSIYLAAVKTKGVLNSVYRFLERNTDIIFAREFEAEDGCGTIYGHHPTIVNTVEDLVDVPVFPDHRFWTGNTEGNVAWQARLLNTFTRPLDGNMSPAVYKRISTLQDVSSMSGSLGLGLIDPGKYYGEHPDFFPLVKGQRVRYHDCQLCFMNPKMIAAFCEEAAKVVAGNPKRVASYSVGLGDNWDVCECPLCLAPITLPGGGVVRPEDRNFRSTQYTLFVNAVSDYLTSRFPHVRPLAGAAYLFTAEAPAVPARGGGPGYCPYIKNHKKPVFDDTINAVWHAKAERFKQAGMPAASLYEYYLCSSTPQFYHAVCEVARQDFNYYRPHLKGVYLDVVYGDAPEHGGDKVYDISAIEFWVMSRLMWNPDTDVREARREFCRRAYREAAEPMIAYYERLAQNYNEDPAGCYWNDDPVSACKHYLVDKGLTGFVRETLAKAVGQAAHPGSRRLIELHQGRMLGLIGQAEKLPPRVTLQVPFSETPPAGDDVNAAEWAPGALIDGFSKVSDAKVPSSRKSTVRFLHDKRNLYIAARFEDPGFFADYQAGKFARNANQPGFGWGGQDGPYVELFVDGGLRAAGSYYHLAFALNGSQYSGRGASAIESDPPQWTVSCRAQPGYWTARVVIPLAEIGVNITQGNKLGAMIVANDGAWNGGQWHSPTGFQTLVLEMK